MGEKSGLSGAAFDLYTDPPWRIAHTLLAIVIVAGSVVHAILIEGTMETVTKAALCALVLAAAIKVMVDLRVRRKRGRLRGENIARQ